MAALTPGGDANSVAERYLKNIDASLAAGIPITTGDIEIGAVEIKDGTTDTRVAVAAGTVANALRVTLGSDDPLVATVTASRVATNPIAGQAGIAGGTGVDGATVPRVSLATNVALPAGANVIGHVIVDAGAAVIGSLAASELHIGEVGGNAISISPTVTVSTSPAYSANDVVGTKLTLTNACRVSAGLTRLNTVVLTDTSAQNAAMQILLYNANPAATYTDNGACPAQSTDVAAIIGRVPVVAGDWATQGAVGIAFVQVDRILKSAATANLWAVIVTTGTPTYAATTAIAITFNFDRY